MMKQNQISNFLTDYLQSLYERSRLEKTGYKIGFDWVIYRLALAKNWFPIRLPFFRRGRDKIPKSKTEAEFGIDLSFVSLSKKQLYIFVLKDEELTNRNWTKHNFDTDLRMAAAPNLEYSEVKNVTEITIILAYNKDEDNTGIRLYNSLAQTLGGKIYNDKVNLKFERWNLSRIVEEVQNNLVTPDLLPQHLSEQFRYVCSQIKDFDFGTEQWEKQLIPNWKQFLKILLKQPDERNLRLVPVMLTIANNHRKNSPNSYAGWIDLAEWSLLILWNCYRQLRNKKLKKIIINIWIQFYIFELEKYFVSIEKIFSTQHGFSNFAGAPNYGVSTINDAYMAYWHIGRLGILTLAPQELEPQVNELLDKVVVRSADWLVKCLYNNPACLRPLVDLNHIELFLTWLILWQTGKEDDMYEWLSELENRLLMRRVNEKNTVPFIESRSRMNLLVEYATTGEKPSDYSDSSSYLLLMLLEIICSLKGTARDKLLKRYYNRLVMGIGNDGKSVSDKQIDLVGWTPPDNWEERILEKAVWDGIAITTDNFISNSDNECSVEPTQIITQINALVTKTREQHPWKTPQEIPLSVFILACIKNRSPLPPEFWRGTIFPIQTKSENEEN